MSGLVRAVRDQMRASGDLARIDLARIDLALIEFETEIRADQREKDAKLAECIEHRGAPGIGRAIAGMIREAGES